MTTSQDNALEQALQRGAGASPVTLQHWEKQDGGSAIPFFTSVATLERAVAGPQPFVALPVRTLFAMTAGAELFLNPKPPYGKSFAPDEVTALLSNDGDAYDRTAGSGGGDAYDPQRAGGSAATDGGLINRIIRAI